MPHIKYNYEVFSKIAEFIKNKVPCPPQVLIICGSGLGTLADTLCDPTKLNYKDIPNFPVSSVEGHAGKLVFGSISDVNVLCMQGRFHYYEGYSLHEVTAPIRVAHLLGVKYLIVTNAAGGINPKHKVGDIMLINDHINLLGFAGVNALRGPNDPRFGPRFLPMIKTYDRDLITKAKCVLKNLDLEKNSHEGVYTMVGGPTYETLAEFRALRTLGADAVGMSTIPEVIVARDCGMTVFGFSLITDTCVNFKEEDCETSHSEVLKAVSTRAEQLKSFVIEFVKLLGL